MKDREGKEEERKGKQKLEKSSVDVPRWGGGKKKEQIRSAQGRLRNR